MDACRLIRESGYISDCGREPRPTSKLATVRRMCRSRGYETPSKLANRYSPLCLKCRNAFLPRGEHSRPGQRRAKNLMLPDTSTITGMATTREIGQSKYPSRGATGRLSVTYKREQASERLTSTTMTQACTTRLRAGMRRLHIKRQLRL